MDDLKDKMQKTVESTKLHFAAFRTGRANPEVLNHVLVEYYGTMTPINQVAAVTVPESRILMLNVFDKTAIKAVEKALLTSDLGLNPQVDGNIIRLSLPELTEERRKELVRLLKKQAEEGRVSLRNVRRDFIEKVKKQQKDKEISEDESKKHQEDIQKITDQFIKEIDVLAKDKEEEIMTI